MASGWRKDVVNRTVLLLFSRVSLFPPPRDRTVKFHITMEIKRISLILIVALIGANTIIASERYFSDDVLLDRIITAEGAGFIPPENLPDREWINFKFSISRRILEIIQANPNNDKAWKALNHYATLTDAGLTSTFHKDCFHAIKARPLLFYKRYLKGDENALKRMEDSMCGCFIYPPYISHSDYQRNIEIVIAAITKQDPLVRIQRERHMTFLSFIKEYFEAEKRKFKELMSDET